MDFEGGMLEEDPFDERVDGLDRFDEERWRVDPASSWEEVGSLLEDLLVVGGTAAEEDLRFEGRSLEEELGFGSWVGREVDLVR